MLPSPGQYVLLPAAATSGGLTMTRWGRRGLFGVAASKEEESVAAAADASPLDLDIGGEGGYFDHDAVRAGAAAGGAAADELPATVWLLLPL